MEKAVHIEGLGDVVFRRSARAKRYLLCLKDGQIVATMPLNGSDARMHAFIARNIEKLRRALEAKPARERLDESTALQTFTFRLHIFRSQQTGFYMTLKENTLHIACPAGTDFADDRVQPLLRRMLKKALRHEATRVLPPRLATLAAQHGFRYAEVTIRDVKTRWGSCSTAKNISLSLSLLLLPAHLIDYVMLHELCHTVEMNHSTRFWQLMDRVTDNRAKTLRSELKRFKGL